MNELKQAIDDVEARIEEACKRANRKREDVTLIAVSKTVSSDCVKEAIREGIHNFGENRVQELMNKKEEISDSSISWHLIGHLQTNKAKYIGSFISMIHSLDSEKLAVEIDRIAEKHHRIIDVLVQVNVAKEESKFGLPPEDVFNFVKKISVLKNIRIRGLMTIAPFVENPEENRKHFKELHKIMVDFNKKNRDNINMNVLSMGMTGDYEVAIEEGATHIRVGTGIFGERDYHI